MKRSAFYIKPTLTFRPSKSVSNSAYVSPVLWAETASVTITLVSIDAFTISDSSDSYLVLLQPYALLLVCLPNNIRLLAFRLNVALPKTGCPSRQRRQRQYQRQSGITLTMHLDLRPT